MGKNPFLVAGILIALMLSGCREKKEPEKIWPKVEDDFILVEGGTFRMGDDSPVKAGRYKRPSHETSVSSFYISALPVLQSEYNRISGLPTADTKARKNLFPATNISWYEALAYCNRLSIKVGAEPAYYMSVDGKDESDPDKWGTPPRKRNADWDSIKWKKDANGYRLPTEAEWEYAARGGLKSGGFSSAGTDFDSPTLREYAWFMLNSDFSVHQCGTLKPNELGLYDMCGNAAEWVWDWFSDGYYYLSDEAAFPNPSGPESGEVRCCRGASFTGDRESMQVFARGEMSPELRSEKVGLRLCRNADKEPEEMESEK